MTRPRGWFRNNPRAEDTLMGLLSEDATKDKALEALETKAGADARFELREHSPVYESTGIQGHLNACKSGQIME